MFNGYGEQVAHLYDGMDLNSYTSGGSTSVPSDNVIENNTIAFNQRRTYVVALNVMGLPPRQPRSGRQVVG